MDDQAKRKAITEWLASPSADADRISKLYDQVKKMKKTTDAKKHWIKHGITAEKKVNKAGIFLIAYKTVDGMKAEYRYEVSPVAGSDTMNAYEILSWLKANRPDVILGL